ncbi:phospho-sugar glycosidase domain-containing protein [Lactococcus cremoris]|uniref:phospho-sugar glycosidase domain-containing protein n=1 Tax=Lactococcus lactis subsp. cremoris TaxID=1359 RepID=UPI00352A9C11
MSEVEAQSLLIIVTMAVICMGEIQIVKNDLAADEKVNVVGKIIAEDRPLITFIGSGQKFKIEKEKNND